MTREHKALLEYVAQESHSLAFNAYIADHQSYARIDSEERYLSYALLIYSGTQNRKLRVDLQNDFTTGNNLYPKPRPQNIHLLDKYSKIVVLKRSTS